MKKVKLGIGALVTMALVGLTARPASAQVGVVAREVIEQGVEQILKSAGRDAAAELAEAGGRAGVREVLERAAAEGGEGLVRKTAAIGAEYGPAALRVINRSPAKMVGALEGVSAELRPAAIRAVEREPAAVTRLVERFGPDGLDAAARHPGVATTIGEKLGGEGLTAARSLTTEQAVVVGRHADEIAALAPADRASLLGWLKARPAAAAKFLETHPKTMWTAATLAVVMAAKDELLAPGGGPSGAGRGLVPQIWHDAVGVATRPLGLALTAAASVVVAWAAGKIWVGWRRRRVEARTVGG